MSLRPHVVLFALAAALPAQNPFEWQKRTAEVEYFPVPLGSHSLSELPAGRVWRLGAHQPTVLRLTMPAIVGEKVIVPGDHIVQLQRTSEVQCTLVGDAGLGLDGPLGKAAKPTKKLTIELQKAGAAKAGSQPVKIVVQYGENEWSSAMTLPGNKTSTVGGWKLAVFQLPASLLAARGDQPVPVAVLQKDDETAFNLVLGKDDVKLVPWRRVPRGINHGPVPAPNPTPSEEGSIPGTVEELKLDKPATRANVESLKATMVKGELLVELAFGDEAVRVRVPEPKVSKDKKGK